MRLKSTPDNITLDCWFELWLTKYKRNISQGTKISYLVAYKHYSSILGFREIRDLNQEDFYELFIEMVEMGHTNTTVKQTKMVMKQCMEKAVDEGLLDSNPVPARFITGTGNTKKLVLSIEEVSAIVNYMKEYNFSGKNIVLFLFYTGMRSGEIRALTWNDIFFRKEMIYVRRNLRDIYTKGKRVTLINGTKTNKSIRFIPMTDDVKKVLKAMSEKDTFIDSKTSSRYGELVFPLKGREMSNNDIYYIFRKLVCEMNANGYPMRQLTPQVGRRTFASLCFASGIDAKVISELLGHESISTTMNYYIKPDVKFLSREMKKLGNGGVKMA